MGQLAGKAGKNQRKYWTSLCGGSGKGQDTLTEWHPFGTAFRGASFIVLLLIAAQIACHRGENGDNSQPETSGKEVASQALAQADQLYAQRENLAYVRQAIALLRQARVADYGNYEVTWKLAKYNFYLGSHTPDERERDTAFREGVETGKVAVQLNDNGPEGHFWLGANYGGSAEHSTLAGLASVEDIRTEMEAVLKRDEGYQNGSAYLALGQLYSKAPRVLGGDNQKAIEYLEKGLRFGADNALLRLQLAETYHDAGRNEDARKQIDYLMKMTPDKNYMPEYNEAVAGAKKLEEKLQ